MRFIKTFAALALLAGIGATQAATLTAGNSTFGSFDANSGTRTLSIAGSGSVTDVNIVIDFAKCNDPAMQPNQQGCPADGEEFAGEIFFYLLSPIGTRVDLVFGGTYSTSLSTPGRYLVDFDDEAGAAVGPTLTSGSFRPVELLSAFDGEQAFGNWVLGIGDTTVADPLSFFSARLVVETSDGTVPAPGALLLSGAALLAAGATRRRRQR